MVLRFLGCALILTASVWGQINSFPKPSYFRETFTRPDTRVELHPPARLQDFMVDNKLELSLRSYLELVMSNNTDIAIQRLSVETPKNAILRAFAPFDPLLNASFNNQRSKTPSNDVLAGASTVVQLQQPASFSYQQTLQNGTQYTATFFGQKISNNSGFQNFNPALTSNLGVSFVQPLIRNRGAYVNRLTIMQARSRLRTAEYNLSDQILRILETAENAYWDLVLARDNLRVQEKALELANESLKRANRELELGASSPLDIYQPQQVQATAEIAVSQAKFVLLQREDALRRQMGADLDPQFRKMPVVLTEDVLQGAETEQTIDPEMAVEKALIIRPDLKAAIQNIDVDDLQIKSAQNSLKPDLSLTAAYTAQGRGGTFYQRSNVFTDTGARNTIVSTIPGGFGDALDQLFGFGYPVYAFGLRLRLPIRNRQAAADMADALVAKRRDTLQIRNVEQQVRLDVLQFVNQVESSKAAVKLAKVALDFAQKRLDAEQKKYELGTSQIYFVLQAQQDLVTAQGTLVQNSVQYRRNLLGLLRRTGELLEQRGVAIQ